MASPQVSIIIVAHNSQSVLMGCLRSIRRILDRSECEVIIVDNASTDDTIRLVTEQFPQFKLVRSSRNLGFAGGLNLGFKEAAGKYYLVLNPDTIITPSAIPTLLTFLEKNPKAGVAGATLTYPNGSAQDSTFDFPSLPRELLNYLPELKTLLRPRQMAAAIHRIMGIFGNKGDNKVPYRVECVSGAALLVRSDIVKQLDGFDEGFFLYHEERDFCHRVWNEGREVWTVPQAQVIHLDAHGTGYRRNRLPSMPVLGWRVAGMDRLWWKHRGRGMHRLWRMQTRCLLRLRIIAILLSLPFRGERKSAALSRIQELKRCTEMLCVTPVSECERPER